MKTVTWVPGTNKEMDDLFDQLREDQFQDKSHRLWKNYSKEEFYYISADAYTIFFDDQGLPELCSSILYRSCWPINFYRILNRAWKPNNRKTFLRKISDCMGESAKDQINWLKENRNPEVIFVSRQTDNWNDWVVKNFKEQFNLDFKSNENKYLTCPNECDENCWQKIIYIGNEESLKSWKHK